MENLGIVDYSRQEAMDQDMSDGGLEKNEAHIVVGCGGVGFWLAFMLAMNGASRLIICDGQTIEPSNLNRIPVPQTFVGKNKTIALRKMIKMVRPECLVACIPLHVTDDAGFNSLLEVSQGQYLGGSATSASPSTLWDCTDDARVQRKLASFVLAYSQRNAYNLEYRKLGYEGYKVGFYQKMEAVWYDEATYQPGYRTSKANAMSSALTAAFGIFAQGLEAPKDITLDLKTIIQTGGEQCTSTTNTRSSRGTTGVAQPLTRARLVEEIVRGTQAQRLPVPITAAMGTRA